jgi:hypothetical protein
MAEPEVRLERISVFFDERVLAYDTGSGFFEYPPQCVAACRAWLSLPARALTCERPLRYSVAARFWR